MNDHQKFNNARKDAEYLMNGAFDPDRQPISDEIEKAIRLEINRDGIDELCIALEDAARREPGIKRCVTDLLARWLYVTDTGGRRAA
ncbi:hypothetical protein [Halomonas cupida]|uniref:hypothetical protein n=1 Tax=Halomonas cupida TaxID=44933 RepID=UPI003A95B866